MHINATKPGDERAREDMQVEETTPSTPLRPTRAGFVRGLPLTMPVEEVIERGREVGIELQPSDIHAARYYMRQMAAAESSSIPQQLMLGGTFVTKPAPRVGNGAAAKTSASNGSANGTEKLASSSSATGVQRLRDPDYDDDPEPQTSHKARAEEAAPKKAARSKAASKAAKVEVKANGANGLHSRLQARLRNATFRDTTRDEREVSAREVKATVGKALLMDLNNALKPRNKRAAQTTEAMEEQLRLIALRIGTQRVRELVEQMEELAARA
jgi:hypothetical protein